MSRGGGVTHPPWDLEGGEYSPPDIGPRIHIPLEGTPPVLTSTGGHWSGPYASYWSRFLFSQV